jgi:hypothetical protein
VNIDHDVVESPPEVLHNPAQTDVAADDGAGLR